MLDTDTLERLENALHDQRAPVADLLRPGLTDSEIDRLTEPLGLELPDELRAWWRWHDGSDFGAANLKSHGSIGLFPFRPLANGVDQTLFQRELAISWADDEPHLAPDWWADGWFAVTDYEGHMIACDCSADRSRDVPTFIRDHSAPRSMSTPGAQGFGVVVEGWVDALESRLWRWSMEDGYWHVPVEGGLGRAIGLV